MTSAETSQTVAVGAAEPAIDFGADRTSALTAIVRCLDDLGWRAEGCTNAVLETCVDGRTDASKIVAALSDRFIVVNNTTRAAATSALRDWAYRSMPGSLA